MTQASTPAELSGPPSHGQFCGHTVSRAQVPHAFNQGASTPLRIRSLPPQPHFPLYISSLGSGRTQIDVYVVSPAPMKDRQGTLKMEQQIPLNGKLGTTVAKALGMELAGQNRVARFTFAGELGDLKEDAVFVNAGE